MIRLLLFLLITATTLGQVSTLKDSYLLVADSFIGIDGYESTYTITDNIVMKSGVKGDFQFSDIQLGSVTSVDILNPLKVIVYYHEFNTVVFLDNRLSEIERINFNNLPDFINTGAAQNAGNNRLWLLNTDTQQVEIYNYSTKKRTEISQPITDEIIDVASNFNYFFILTDQEIRKYNIYGGLINVFKISGGKMMVQENEDLVVMTDSQLLFKSKENSNFAPHSKQEIEIVNLQLRQDLLYIYNGEKIATISLY